MRSAQHYDRMLVPSISEVSASPAFYQRHLRNFLGESDGHLRSALHDPRHAAIEA